MPKSYSFVGRRLVFVSYLYATALVVLSSPAMAAEFDTTRFVSFDTSRLLGSPDPLPPLEIEPAFPALEFVRPVAIAHAGDGSGRLFVVDQPGIVYVFPARRDVERAEVFLDIRARVGGDHFEEGLLGLAFHPRYEETGEFFVYYSVEAPRASVVSRFRVSSGDADRADPEFEEIVLRVPQPYGNHNGGGIEFGPDGMLYVPLGDGGDARDPHGNGQNLKTLLGSILRIDIDGKDPGRSYAIPRDNPFVDAPEALGGEEVRGEIWAYGMRNPWRMTFDRLTGACWVGDVGQDLWEEIDIIKKGGNYGWKVREGRHPFAPDAPTTGEPFVEPIFEYPREEGKSITGGLVYRGQALPELYGAYLYADFVTFNVWALRYDGEKVTSNHVIARSQLPVTAFGEDESGEVYIAAFEAAQDTDVRRLSMREVFWLNKGSLFRFRRRAAADAVDTTLFPRRLSETGLFTDIRSLTPAPALIPYSVNVPLWSDGASKSRYLVLPAAGKVEFDATGQWIFPVGTVFVKTFELEPGSPGGEQRLETRLLVHNERGWAGYTYLWNDERSDARLLDTALRRTYTPANGSAASATSQEWYFPSRSDCNACHTQVAGHVLGLNTRQLNRTHDYGATKANQLAVLAGLGVFAEAPQAAPKDHEAFPDWDDRAASVDRLARAYLDVNCAICHAPGGTGVARADLRYHTPLAAAHVVGQEPGQTRLGGADSRVVAPGAPQRSELFLRMVALEAGRMPTLASSRVDWDAVRIVGRWIERLGAGERSE